jgi:hypothetical protein
MSTRNLIRALLVAALLVLLVVLMTRDDGSVTYDEPRVVSVEQLSEFARDGDGDRPVYWLGERDDSVYELEQTSSGQVYVRYLDRGAKAGEGPGEYVTVVTYPAEDGVAALRRSVRSREGLELGQTGDGAALLIDVDSPKNAHLAYPGDDVHIEIFDPVAGRALRAAARGEVQQVP